MGPHEQNLGTRVGARARELVHELLLRVQLDGEPEVAELRAARPPLHENVLQLQVPVRDAVRVQVSESRHELLDIDTIQEALYY